MATIGTPDRPIVHKLLVKIDTVPRIQKFCNICTRYDGDIVLVKDRYTVNAKSIMGVYSLDLSEPMDLFYYPAQGENPADFLIFEEEIKEYVPIEGYL
jgi:hypothetical protein